MSPKRRLQDHHPDDADSFSAEDEVEESESGTVKEEANGVSDGIGREDEESEGDAEEESTISRLCCGQITSTLEEPEIAFTGDTMADIIVDDSNIDALLARILVMEEAEKYLISHGWRLVTLFLIR